jgi:hypothetical protein
MSFINSFNKKAKYSLGLLLAGLFYALMCTSFRDVFAQEMGANGIALTVQEFFSDVEDVQAVLAQIVEENGESTVVPATWRSIERSVGTMAIARFSVIDVRQSIGLLFIAVGRGGSVHSRYREVVPYDLARYNFMDSNGLRQRYVELQDEYQKIKADNAESGDRKRRQQRDSRVRASLMRLASLGAGEESGKLESVVTYSKRPYNESHMRTLADRIRDATLPRNIEVREQGLLKQVQELSLVSVLPEPQPEREADDVYTLEEKLRLIEQTRFEQIAVLEAELESMRASP